MELAISTLLFLRIRKFLKKKIQTIPLSVVFPEILQRTYKPHFTASVEYFITRRISSEIDRALRPTSPISVIFVVGILPLLAYPPTFLVKDRR